jgi:hypothetical protein
MIEPSQGGPRTRIVFGPLASLRRSILELVEGDDDGHGFAA